MQFFDAVNNIVSFVFIFTKKRKHFTSHLNLLQYLNEQK